MSGIILNWVLFLLDHHGLITQKVGPCQAGLCALFIWANVIPRNAFLHACWTTTASLPRR